MNGGYPGGLVVADGKFFEFPTSSGATGNPYGVGGGVSMPNGTVCELIRPRAESESWTFTNLDGKWG